MLSLGATLALIGSLLAVLIGAEAMLASFDRRMRQPRNEAAVDG